MRRPVWLLAALALLPPSAVALAGLAWGQAADPAAAGATAPPPAEARQPSAEAVPGWEPRCTSAGRTAPADCTLEQRLLLQQTGQPFLTLTVRVPAAPEPRRPFLLVQTPLGLHLPSGLALRVDGREPLQVQIERCDGNGCYAGGPLSADLLAALKGGRVLNVTLRTVDGRDLGLAVPLAGFTAGYGAIQ